MTFQEDPHLLRSISRRLAETADREQVIEEVCMLQNLPWSEAEALIDQALVSHQSDITRQQTPILVLVALAIFISGAALAAWQVLGLAAVVSAVLNPRAESFWEVYNRSFGFFDVLTNFWGMLGAFVAGLAMVLGSYFGMKDVYLAWLEALDDGNLLKKQPASSPVKETSGPELASAAQAVFSAESWVRKNPDDLETVEFILSSMEKTNNRDWVVTSLAMSHGLSWPAADELVDAVLRARGETVFERQVYPPALVFSLLGIFIAGLVISLQYLMVSSIALRWAWEKVTNQYWLVWFFYQVGEYIERAPGLFITFVLGAAMFIGGLLSLRAMLPSVYRWGSKSW